MYAACAADVVASRFEPYVMTSRAAVVGRLHCLLFTAAVVAIKGSGFTLRLCRLVRVHWEPGAPYMNA